MAEWKSQPLAALLAEVGEAVACLNTAVVGLDAVEKGHEKPDGLDVSWSPDDRRAASRKARKFLVEAVLVRVFESLYEHLDSFARLPRFVTIVDKWNSKTSKAEKIKDIYQAIIRENYLVVAAVLVAHWRNRIVHTTSKAKLTVSEKKLLRDSDLDIEIKYKGLSVDCLLCHFEERRPTLKDVSSLIAMIINLAREIDARVSSDLDKNDLDAWLSHLGLDRDIERITAETKPEKLTASIRRMFASKAPILLSGYDKYYSHGVG
jgi:hypothetical protein